MFATINTSKWYIRPCMTINAPFVSFGQMDIDVLSCKASYNLFGLTFSYTGLMHLKKLRCRKLTSLDSGVSTAVNTRERETLFPLCIVKM